MKKENLVVAVVFLFLGFAIMPSINADMNKTGFESIPNLDYDSDDGYDFDIEDRHHVNPLSDAKPTLWWDNWPDFPARYEPFFDVSDIEDMGQSANGLTSADFNNDDLLDFAVSWATVPWTQAAISIFYNDGEGGFTRDDVYILDVENAYYIYDLDSGDFDNDSDIDLMFTYSESDWDSGIKKNGTVNILFNDGEQNYNNPVMVAWHPIIPPNIKRINPQLTSADYDDDGDIDFIVGDNSGLVEFYKNDGTGDFISGGIYDFGGEMSWGLASADFDNDGDIDFIVSQRKDLNAGYLYLVWNDGSDSCFNHSDFIQIAELDLNLNIFFAGPVFTWGYLEPIDYNDDGMMDFVYAGSESIFLYMQKDIGVFDYFHIIRLPGPADGTGGWYIDTLYKGGISIGDFNGDNKVDMVIGGVQGIVRMCYNNLVLVDIIKPDKAAVYSFNEINYNAPFPFKYPIMIYSFLQHGKSIAIGALTIEAKALEPLQKVEFYLDLRLMHTDDSEPYEWNWDKFSFGRHKVTAVAYDLDGEPAGSDDTFVWKFL